MIFQIPISVQFMQRDCATGALFKRMSHSPANIFDNLPIFLALGGEIVPICIEH